MILLTPNNWVLDNGQPTVDKPISLLSGNRLCALYSTASVYALQRAGVPSAGLTVEDYIHMLRMNPGPNGQPTHGLPAPYANVGLL